MPPRRRPVAQAAEEAAGLLDAALEAAGLPLRAYLGAESLALAWAGQAPELLARYGAPGPPGEDRDDVDPGAAKGAVCLALPYDEGPAELPSWSLPPEGGDPGPMARLGRFARADWYGELAARAGEALALARKALEARGIEPGPRSAWRRLVNSPLPERPPALLSGLGRRCLNGLLAVEGAGPGLVLGLVLLPFEPPAALRRERSPAEALAWHPACSTCLRPCELACPGGALGPAGDFRRGSCLQHWASIPEEPPPELAAVWGERLYGCDACLEACPLFRAAARSVPPAPEGRAPEEVAGARQAWRGALGPGLPAAWILRVGDDELRTRLAGTALGMAFIGSETLRRNARLALASRWLALASRRSSGAGQGRGV